MVEILETIRYFLLFCNDRGQSMLVLRFLKTVQPVFKAPEEKVFKIQADDTVPLIPIATIAH